MKKLIFVLISMSYFAQAHPRFPIVLESKMDQVQMDPLLFDESLQPEVTLFIRRSMRQMALQFDFKVKCAEGQLCILGFRSEEISAKLVKIQRGSCGQVIYLAETDNRPSDGRLTQIRVVDHSRDFCRYFIAVPATEVSLLTHTMSRSGERMTKSTFSGSRLRRVLGL